MGIQSPIVFYPRADFVALTGSVPIEQLRTKLAAVPQTVTIVDVRLSLQRDGVIVEWLTFPSAADVAAIDAEVAAFAGGATTSEPFEIESLGITNAAADGSLTTKIDFTTPALDGGVYTVFWDSLVGMLATVSNAGVRGVFTISRMNSDGSGLVSRQWEHGWDKQQPQLFGSGLTFKVTAGQKIRTLLQVQKLGAVAATAQIASARITIDQISAAA